MPFENDFLRKKELSEIDQKRRQERSALDFDLTQEEITAIDGLLLSFRDEEKLSLDDYGKIMDDLGPALYKTVDDNIVDYWVEILGDFKDTDTATAILNKIDKYQQKDKAA